MDFRKQTVSLQQVKETDLVDYLSELGHQPARINASNYWYHSPLRIERTPSFKVNRRINRWYDYGIGKGGNLIDFGIMYHQCSVGELLESFNGRIRLHQPTPQAAALHDVDQSGNLVITDVNPISSPLLSAYLSERKISLQTANRFCQQVSYQIGGREFFALGFKNDSGGYELRNAFSKLSSSPKDFTTFNNGADSVSVFEGFFDLMSFIQLAGAGMLHKHNYVVLNSISFFQKARSVLETHNQIRLYLDHDKPGLDLTSRALALDMRYQDAGMLYKEHKDLNEWLIARSQVKQKSHKLSIGDNL